jgi:CRP-like cAMP-binding protein
LLAAGVFSYVLGTFVSLIDAHFTEVFEFQTWIDSLVVFLKDPQFRLTTEFQKQVIEYVYHCQYETSQYKDLSVIENLSPAMKQKIMFAYHGSRLHRLPYLSNAPNAFIARLAQRLKVLTEAADQWIMRAGFIGQKMYVLVEGVAYVAEEANATKEDDAENYKRDNTFNKIETTKQRRSSMHIKQTLKHVSQGKPKWEELRAHGLLIEKVSTIGYESMLFPQRRRHIGVKTYSICQMYTLTYKAFAEELSDYPEFSVQLRSQMMRGLWKTYMRKPRFLHNLVHFHDKKTLESPEFDAIYNKLIDSRISRILAGVNLNHVKEKLILHATSKRLHEDTHQKLNVQNREKILEDLHFASVFHGIK